ncbi:MAG: hypothetical protein GXP55_19635, partial [Deltaproteobacteria bacterium]|nr:hypothetical protein [Deltaproteobacteria bacterium]
MQRVQRHMFSRPSTLSLGAACVLGLLVMGCGPRMVPHVRDVRAFSSPEPCAQGPFEIRQATQGEPYGESYALVIYSPRAIRGHYQALYDGEVMSEGEFGQRREIMVATDDRDYPYRVSTLSEDEPDNARCLVPSAASGGAASTGGQARQPARDPFAPGAGASTREPSASAVTPSLVPAPWPHDQARLYGPDMVDSQLGRIVVDRWSWQAPAEGGVATEAGVDFTIRLWSDLPNDLEGVMFVVEHGFERPNVNDEEWAAHQEEQRRGAERRRARRQRRAARRNARRQAYCAEHRGSESCWGSGGYDGAIARLNAPRAARTTAPPVSAPPPE